MYCNDLYSLSVLSLYEGELLGVVDKLYFDKKLKKLLELELIGEDDVRLTLPTKNIYRIGKNAITVKNNQAVNLKVSSSENSSCPLGSKAYSINGEYLGIVKEISLNDKYFTEKLSLDNNSTLEISSLASFGKNTIIFYDANNNVDVKKFIPNKSPKIYKTIEPKTTDILPIEPIQENKNIVPIDNQSQQNHSPDFLLGRICIKDIFNFNNELLIKANSVVNKKNLKDIKRFGKLRELMLYIK
ncbi:MAG: PRC-barrel domain-containing protein [Clostridia bacterium]|nr:PRC-barrel domain-containing protein [Clostridia bacterium]